MFPGDLKNIILADDDEDDCLLFQDILSDLKVRTTLVVAQNGQELLQLLFSDMNEPDIIFVDMNMPLLNGIECLKEIRKSAKLSGVPVVILSTSSHAQAVHAAFHAGASLYIRKPDNFKRLRSIVEMLLVGNWVYPKKLEEFLIDE